MRVEIESSGMRLLILKHEEQELSRFPSSNALEFRYF